TGLSGKSITLGVNKSGYKWLPENGWNQWHLTLDPAQQAINCSMALSPSVKVCGAVLSETGKPINSAEVSYLPADDAAGEPRSFPVDSTGSFSLDVCTSKTIRLRVISPGFPRAASEPITVGSQPVEGVIVKMTEGVTLSGQVVDPTGAPMAGAGVAVLPRVFENPSNLSDEVLRATTDADGRFEISGIPPEVVEVEAGMAGFLVSEKQTLDLKTAGMKISPHLALRTAHFIAGKVTDADGNPLGQATVFAFRGNQYSRTELGSTQTTNDGTYRIALLPEGKIEVGASAPWGDNYTQHDISVDRQDIDFVFSRPDPNAGHWATMLGKVVDSQTGQPLKDFQVKADNTLTIATEGLEPGFFKTRGKGPYSYTIEIAAPGYLTIKTFATFPLDRTEFEHTFEMGAGATIRGRVVNENGMPLKDATVQTRVGTDQRDLLYARSGEGGEFALEDVPQGKWILAILPVEVMGGHYREIQVKFGQRIDLGDIQFDTNSALRGRVVRMPGETGVAGLNVELGKGEEDKKTVKTSQSGGFEFTGMVPDIEYAVSVPEKRISLSTFYTTGTEQLVIALGEATLKGRVLKSGRPVGARVSLRKLGGPLWSQVSTDDSGEFEFTELVGGDYWLGANSAEDWRNSTHARVNVAPKGVTNQDLDLGKSSLMGVVLGEAGEPVAGAKILVASQSEWGRANAMTNDYFVEERSAANGEFRFNNLSPSVYTLCAELEGKGSVAATDIAVGGPEPR
ncbi:MAG: carboxypeptidase-like regulatory domain-containing protein, partial [bacterium]